MTLASLSYTAEMYTPTARMASRKKVTQVKQLRSMEEAMAIAGSTLMFLPSSGAKK